MTTTYAKDQPVGFRNSIEKVAIVGASGTMGSRFVDALLKTGKHTVTALTRADSKNKLPDGIKTVTVDYDDEDTVVAALQGQDFFIITLSVFAPGNTSSKLVRAALKAGVKYIMPNVYGPDPMNVAMGEEMIIGRASHAQMKEITDLGMTFIALSCGYWYEFSLGGGTDRYGFDFKNRQVIFVDDGEEKITTSTWPQCGRAVGALLSLKIFPDDADDKSATLSQYFNNACYVSSFCVSQKDMFESVKRVTSTTDKDWKITHENSKERWQGAVELMKTGDRRGFGRAMYTRGFYPNGGNNTSDKLSNDVLGLPKEDLDEWTKTALDIGLPGGYSYS